MAIQFNLLKRTTPSWFPSVCDLEAPLHALLHEMLNELENERIKISHLMKMKLMKMTLMKMKLKKRCFKDVNY